MNSTLVQFKLNKIKIKNKCVNILKYYLIHSYDSELLFLFKTLEILKMKYPSYVLFVDNIYNLFNSSGQYRDGISEKIKLLVNYININNCYDLYEDIINTLEV